MPDPLVSIVIPAYNAEKWIGYTLHSIAKQTYQRIEVIVVDDGSTDRTTEIVSQHPDVRLIRLEENLGECRATRIGFFHAIGRYICRLSADDMFIRDDHIAEQVNIMEHSGADFCYNSLNVHTGDETTLDVQSYWLPIPRRWMVPGLHRFDNLILSFPYLTFILITLRNPVNSSTLMVRSRSYSYYRTHWSDIERTDCDQLLIMDMLLKRFHGIAIHTSGVYYRVHSNQGSADPNYESIVRKHRREKKKEVLNGKYPFWMKLLIRLMDD